MPNEFELNFVWEPKRLTLNKEIVDSLQTGREWVEDLGERAAQAIAQETPRVSGKTLTLIHKGGARYSPGGAGGGGVWEMSVGILQSPRNTVLYVHRGTAGGSKGKIYPRDDRAPASVVATRRSRLRKDDNKAAVPIGKRRALMFQKGAEPVRFRFWVSGQDPNPFVYTAYKQVRLYAGFKFTRISNELIK